MNGFTNWMEKHFVPIAAKIGSQKFLVAIRDAFIAIMPITMAGAFSTLLNVFFRDLPTEWGWTGFVEAMQPVITVNGNVWWGTLAILSMCFVFALGYQLSKVYRTPPLAGGLIAFASFIAVTPQSIEVTSEAGEVISAWGNLNWTLLDARGLFTALFIGFFSTIIYAKLMNRNITIKLPDTVPPAVSKAFAAIIPGIVAIYLSGILAFIVSSLSGLSIGELILKYVQMPFLGLSQGLVAVLIIVLAVQLFWFFGLHGTNVLGPILDGVYLSATAANNSAYMMKESFEYLWTRGSFDAYVWLGGAGCTLALIIAILIVSKREDSRAVAKLSLPMGAFNINEPVVFGMPIVLNPIYFIPWIIVLIILTLIAYGATAIGLIPPVFNAVPWIMPPVLYAFFATGGNLIAAGVALLNLVIAISIWSVFVIIANKVELKEASGSEE
ncbi:PTS sugar transporter subunit IIC [Amedibacillus dolichus]|uniref:PTS sugar transporter subunit IIC n=1 Tax=Amedibacillus dolichus TaxID=31971 RepID=UPI001EDA22D8|nr:PTS sugar transporter subunit IIC [Amedibacillus dolichus]MCG4880352.1 PTS sugar transporter subunit IIC [Amedibacillus dolichus]